MRALDWPANDLGPPQHWPENLRVAVSLCLTSRIPIVIYWGPRHIVLYNDPYISFLGETKHPSVLGRPGWECWPEIWDIIGPMIDGVRATGQATWSQDLRMYFARRLPLEEVYVRFTFGPILAADGRTVEGIFCPCTETTERVVGERRLETLTRLAVRSTEERDVGAACNQAATVLEANPADVPFAAIYVADENGRRAELRCSTGCESELLPPVVAVGDTSPFRALLASVLDSRDIVEDPQLDEFATRIAARAPHEGPVRALALPLHGSAHDRATGLIVVGVSSRRVLDRDYRAFLSLVARHIGTALSDSKAYDTERRRAESLADQDREKTAFFTNVSHELRTPLTLMLSPVEEILSKSEGLVDPEDRKLLALARRNGHRLLKLVNTMLDFSRIEAGRTEAVYVPTDLAALTAGLAGSFRAVCQRAGLELVVDCPALPAPVYVDHGMWEKVVLNLMSNALNFTFEGHIEIMMRSSGDHAVLTVTDTGTGIPASELPHLFERFYRVEGTHGRSHSGTGIGLALTQELVRLHGGSIRVESALARGSAFIVSIPLGDAHLPRERVSREAPASAGVATTSKAYIEGSLPWLPAERDRAWQDRSMAEQPAGTEGRILVADDDADLRDYVCELLHGRYVVQEATDGEAALAAALSSPPDLVVADVMMPRLDGFGLLRALRENPATRTVPVILLSARAGEESRTGGMEAGADDYIVKPFSSRELLARVGAHLGLARLRRETDAAIRENEERLRLTLAAAGAAAWSWNMRTNEMTASPELFRLFGISSREKNLFEAAVSRIVAEDRDLVLDQLRGQAARGEELAVEFRIDHPARGLRWHAARGRMVSPGQTLGITIDITERRQAEEALREANRRKDEFLATLAHELRNPLAPMRNALHVMRVWGRETPDQTTRVLEMMERQVNHMIRLVDDLMEVSRITRGKIRLRRELIDLTPVVRRTVETARPLIEAARHTLTLSLPEEPLMVEGDAMRLGQVLTNLLDNAAKYTDQGGRIHIDARQDPDGMAIVSVSDNGQGIPPAALQQVFEMFAQGGRSLLRSQGGLGIGLTLVRRLVELHGGTVEAHSEGVGKGSKFIVRLPAARTSRKAPAPAAHVEAPAWIRGRRVLVVDDNHDAADSLGILLQCLGAEVRVVHDGPDALEVLETFQPSAVVLDLGMPSMDGFELARRIRLRPGGDELTLIALTGWGQEEVRRRSREAGFDHHLIKPASIQTLRSLLVTA